MKNFIIAHVYFIKIIKKKNIYNFSLLNSEKLGNSLNLFIHLNIYQVHS